MGAAHMARNPLFGANDVLKMVSSCEEFAQRVSELMRTRGMEPTSGSLADVERRTFPNPTLILHAHTCGPLSIESANEHLVGFCRCARPPALSFPSWTNVRGGLEASALGAWLLDPSIDAATRVQRHFSFRYDGFEQQLKQARLTGAAGDVARIEARVAAVERDAIQLGHTALRNRRGVRSGIGMPWPGITNIIASTLAREIDYRLLSSIAHSHHWALGQLGFDFEEVDGQLVGTKKVDADAMMWLGSVTFSSTARALWFWWRLYGWDMPILEAIFDATADELRLTDPMRFWRPERA
jgi:hypothetical protein